MRKFYSLFAASLLLAACTSTANDGSGTDGSAGANGDQAAIDGGTMGAPEVGSPEDFVVNVGDRVRFGTNSSSLDMESQLTLNRQAEWLNQFSGVTVTVEGHCDERGTREYNLALGERRANAVADYLAAQGIDSGRMTTISYGKERPAALGSDEATWAQNRRAVTVVNQ